MVENEANAVSVDHMKRHKHPVDLSDLPTVKDTVNVESVDQNMNMKRRQYPDTV
jgi:hypothetical protein